MPKKARLTSFEGKRVTARGRRALEARGPKLREEGKIALLLRGQKTSEKSCGALKTLQSLKSPSAQYLNRRREETRVFEDASEVERLCQRYEAALFGVASHSKKRPDNVVLGRVFDGQVLDMFEFGVEEAGMKQGLPKMVGSKPLLIFVGEWDASEDATKLRNFFTDFLCGQDVDAINLAGLDTVLVLAAAANLAAVQIAAFRLGLRRSGAKVPNVKLLPVARPLVLRPRRSHAPSLELWKAALKVPKQLKPKKRKNIDRNDLGQTLGTVHLGNQRIDDIQTRKVPALKKLRPTDHPDDDF